MLDFRVFKSHGNTGGNLFTYDSLPGTLKI